jgi:hypothetical protein
MPNHWRRTSLIRGVFLKVFRCGGIPAGSSAFALDFEDVFEEGAGFRWSPNKIGSGEEARLSGPSPPLGRT